MMTTSYETLERRRLLRAASDYRKKGYCVTLDPEGSDLPAFLGGLRPDMIAQRSDENIVIEVRSRATLRDGEPNLVDLAKAVEAQPDWRLDLIVTNPRHAPDEPLDGEEPSAVDIRGRIGVARELLDEGHDEAAALLAWSAVEAALRELARREALALNGRQPEFVIEQLYSVGLLGKEDYSLLLNALSERNLIAHGFVGRGLSDSIVTRVIDIADEALMTRTR